MLLKYPLIILCCFLISAMTIGQTAKIQGVVNGNDGPIEFASVILDGEEISYTNVHGIFSFDNIETGEHRLEISYVGYATWYESFKIKDAFSVPEFIIQLNEESMLFDEIVVTGTKTFKRKTKSAVIVNVVDSETLDNVQACVLSEGLKFQPGLRVETDCQTCNYTQLRMNGLAGGYSQILINGRPIFSPLTGLYGLEQIPVNMIDKIEVIRGGGSSLYGSSAIGGTVNVLTKIPTKNNFTLSTTYQNINNNASDYILNANGTLVSANQKSGVSLFFNKRDREAYDHNTDNFSEIPEIENTSGGISAFYQPTSNQKIEFNLSTINEYRYGGEMVEGPAHLALQSEERNHNVWMGGLDYQLNFNQGKSSLITYLAWQNTARDHYTGIKPDEEEALALEAHLSNPPYGTSQTRTYQAGIQLNHKVESFFQGSNVFTIGSEYLVDDTFDEIIAYNYLIDQTTKDIGIFAQSDWEILPSLNLLSGFRVDKHNLVDGSIISPRISLLYKFKEYTQVRASYGSGFRAPQAFDTDLHIAFSGGGVSRVILDDALEEERSKSYSLSVNYDKPTDHYVYGFTLEGFYTRLNHAFILDPIGEDYFGELFVKKNDQGATVQGATVELRGNYDRKIQLETGITIQSSRFDNKVKYIDELEGIERFIRTPNVYGFANLSFTPNKKISANLNYVYTGSMIVPHFGGAPNQINDELINTDSFSELSLKLVYSLSTSKSTEMDIYGGVKNIFNSYQDTFDTGKNRDSNFVFGPGLPRTVFVGLKFKL